MSISNPPSFGSPDWQRGYYSAQKLLASVPAGTYSVTVTVPPNAETIIVQAANITAGAYVTMQGVDTSITYAGFQTDRAGAVSGAFSAFFDCSSILDSQVTLHLQNSLAKPWYVYADAGVHVVGDVNKTVNLDGYQYVIPTAPGGWPSDHPLNEISVAYVEATTANATILAAPGVGKRYRLFSAQVLVASGTLWAGISDTSTGLFVCWGANNSPGYMSYGPSGVPLGNNGGVTLNLSAPGTIYGTVAHTTETI